MFSMMTKTMPLTRRTLLTGLVAGAAYASLPRPAFAGETNPVVVELFTSQGCSSCPPADALLGELAKRHDVVALSFNVDYWDYIGWKDGLASPDHGLRAAAYVNRLKLQSQYTPQMIVDGVADVIGNQKSAVLAAIDNRVRRPTARMPLSLAG